MMLAYLFSASAQRISGKENTDDLENKGMNYLMTVTFTKFVEWVSCF